MVLLSKLKKNIFMTHKELVDLVSANLIRESKKLESRKSWLSIRNYLTQLSDDKLMEILNDFSQ